MADFGDPFEPRFYQGHVMHMRLRPRAHQFRYRVFTSYLDIDRLEEATRELRLFSVDRFNLLSFHRADHGPRDGSALRPWVATLCARAGRPEPAKIMLLSVPRMLGYAFNPLSVYYCYGDDGRLETVLYQVKNTFGDQLPYVLPAEASSDGAIRHEQAKAMFVSPFIPMEQTYRFTLRSPGDRLALRIRQGDAEGELLIAAQNGAALPLTDASILRLTLRDPAMTRKIIVGIHWEALRLVLKDAPFRRYPGAERAKPAAAESQMALDELKSA